MPEITDNLLLFNLIDRNDGEGLELILKDRSVNTMNINGLTLVHYAICKKKIDIVKILAKRKPDLNMRAYYDIGYYTPLMSAVKLGDLDFVHFLLDNHVQVNLRDKREQTALHFAYQNGNKEIISLLLEHGADENIRDGFGFMPAYYGGSTDSKLRITTTDTHNYRPVKLLNNPIRDRRKKKRRGRKNHNKNMKENIKEFDVVAALHGIAFF